MIKVGYYVFYENGEDYYEVITAVFDTTDLAQIYIDKINEYREKVDAAYERLNKLIDEQVNTDVETMLSTFSPNVFPINLKPTIINQLKNNYHNDRNYTKSILTSQEYELVYNTNWLSRESLQIFGEIKHNPEFEQ